MIPDIIQETSQGTARIPIQDALFQSREIFCVGEITKENAISLIMQLRYLQTTASTEITMYIDSPGGEVSSGLALYDVMQGITCPVRTVCLGCAYSMAALLLASGNRRDMLPHSRVMIHDPLITGGVGGSALHLDSIAQDLMRARETIAQILVKHTGRCLEEIYEKTRTDTYFDAEEAVAWGLADRITPILWEGQA